jgi:FKBP-type peptidyl-prolyl cis-trans isomerase FklB
MPVTFTKPFIRQQWLASSFLVLISMGTIAGETTSVTNESPEELLKKVSYGIGLNISSNFKKQKISLDKTYFNKGFEDGENGSTPVYDQKTIMAAMQAFQAALQEQQQGSRAEMLVRNKAAAEKFLAENAKKENVITTTSGLQYRVISHGTGKQKPSEKDTVKVHYVGTLLDGTEFDSSYARNEPAEFGLANVIPGWTEALQLMVVGDKFQLFIPASLAYGEGGAGQKIEPNALTIFEVELLEIL